jgi:ATP synthase protein I
MMFRAVFLQVVITISTAIVAGLVVGKQGAVSAALGGCVCVLPNFLFALRLKVVAGRPGVSYPANFFLGEFIKIALIIGLLYFVVREYADLHWPSLLIGMGLALQAGFLAFWKKS